MPPRRFVGIAARPRRATRWRRTIWRAVLFEGRGVERDVGAAVEWVRRAAEQGLVPAQLNLARCYSEGWGVERDAVERVRWFRSAAEQGSAEAMNEVGTAYDHGLGVERDQEVAVDWYRRSAEGGDEYGQFNWAACLEVGKGVDKDEAAAVGWYERAAERDPAPALNNLGLCYKLGVGVASDPAKAVTLFAGRRSTAGPTAATTSASATRTASGSSPAWTKPYGVIDAGPTPAAPRRSGGSRPSSWGPCSRAIPAPAAVTVERQTRARVGGYASARSAAAAARFHALSAVRCHAGRVAMPPRGWMKSRILGP